MSIKPLSDRVLIKPSKETEATVSGIIIPDSAQKERTERGEIIAIGPGRLAENGTRVPMSVKVGDMVMFKKMYSPDEIKVAGVELFIIGEDDVLAIVE